MNKKPSRLTRINVQFPHRRKLQHLIASCFKIIYPFKSKIMDVDISMPNILWLDHIWQDNLKEKGAWPAFSAIPTSCAEISRFLIWDKLAKNSPPSTCKYCCNYNTQVPPIHRPQVVQIFMLFWNPMSLIIFLLVVYTNLSS